ncbi:Hypothetical_protein [Hexamita inflata]|uniref:Hypothetical_protein n=1 Tax=Hexamita inflata TaxID=28002 RepID=A0AA86QQ22_9EUKA|nr:Hypothetical protein HINF_LOCUS48507 [Hexamita inflata]
MINIVLVLMGCLEQCSLEKTNTDITIVCDNFNECQDTFQVKLKTTISYFVRNQTLLFSKNVTKAGIQNITFNCDNIISATLCKIQAPILEAELFIQGDAEYEIIDQEVNLFNALDDVREAYLEQVKQMRENKKVKVTKQIITFQITQEDIEKAFNISKNAAEAAKEEVKTEQKTSEPEINKNLKFNQKIVHKINQIGGKVKTDFMNLNIKWKIVTVVMLTVSQYMFWQIA